ncbi:MAG: TldD/PmbA family protein [Bacilli bacterium]|nr:TldD/PmbA family protein [Bacilli bacterium]
MESEFLKSKIQISKKLVKELLEKYEFVSLLGKQTTGKGIRLSNFNSSISDTGEKECGFVVKIFHQGIYSEYSFTDFDESTYGEIVNKIETKLNVSSSLLSKHMNLTVLEDEPLVENFERKDSGKSYSNEEVMAELDKLVKKAMAYDPRMVQAMGFYNSYVVNSFYISKNRELTQSYAFTNVYLVTVAREGQVIKNNFTITGNVKAEDCFRQVNEKCENSCKLTIELLKAAPIEPGVYDIITDPGVTGLIAHEAFGHGVEMDMFVKKRAKSRLYIEKPVASPLVSMHDGAAAAVSNASFFFDDDGVLAHDTLIIDKGILKGGISDVIAANELGVKPTGNSRRESSQRKAYTRMTNTFFEAGSDKLEDMIKSIKHGYMLFGSNNGMEDPKNWNIQCTAEYGREIVDGKFTDKIVSPVVMSGYVPDLLMSISMVSDGLEITGSGHCGKGHKEWVPVSDGGPCLKARCKLS